jgi:WD40 repeat protein/tRNA A-37 threonylcarbamoyl transferase component Bud32
MDKLLTATKERSDPGLAIPTAFHPMTTNLNCVRCGAPLAPDGSCPRCEFALAAEASTVAPHVSTKSPQVALEDFGDYELLEEIAHGGMGVVYKARQKSLDRIVAVKMILAGQFATKQFVQRFRAEAAAAAVLQHPNIVAIHEVGIHEGHHFFSMDYVQGQNLAQLVGQRPLPPAQAARYVKLIAEAIHYAHEQGILHRDLKPSNVLIDSATDQPRITDFGLAKRLDGESSLTVTGQVLGSPNFMPPEQAGGSRGKVGRQSDVYGLGGILYYLLTARAPFQAESLQAIVTQVLNLETVSPRLLNPAVRIDLETICLKCLEKEPSRRYKNAQDVADELGRFLEGEPIHARPVTRAERVWRWCRRKPVIASLVLALHLALALGVAGVLWEWHRALAGELTARKNQYVSDMNLAQQVWEEGNLNGAQTLLRAHIPRPGEADLRGLEWRYLWKLCRDESLHTLNYKEPDSVWRLVSSPNHSFVAGAGPGFVTLFDGATGRELKKIKLPRATGDYNTWGMSLACASGATNLLAVRIGDDSLALIDVTVNATLMHFRPHETETILALALSPNGRLLATMSERELKLWDISSPTNPAPKLLWPASVQAVSPTIVFSPDGRKVVACGKSWKEGSLGVWDTQTGRELEPFPREHVGYVFAAVFSPDGQLLAVSGVDGRIVIWDFPSRKVKAVLPGHVGLVKALAMAADGHRVISAGVDNTIRIWDLDGQKQIGIRRGHGGGIESIALSPDGKTILSTTSAEIKLWRADLEESADVLDSGDAFCRVALSPDGKWAVTVSIEKGTSPQVWETASRSKKFDLSRIPDHCTHPRFSPDGRLFAVGCEDRNVRLWNTQAWGTSQMHSQPDVILTNDFEANYLAFLPDVKILAVAGVTFIAENPSHSTNRLAFWDLRSLGKLRIFEGAGAGATETNAAASVEFSNDGRLMAIGFRDGAVRLWDFQRQQLLKEFKAHTGYVEYGVNSLSFSPDGHWLASSAGETMVLYNLQRYEALPPISALPSGLSKVCFAPDSKSLISAGHEGRIKFWNLATLKVALTLKHSDGPNAHIVVTPEGNLMASIDGHGILKFWPAASLEEIPKQRNRNEN